MKKALVLTLALLFVFTLFTGCARTDNGMDNGIEHDVQDPPALVQAAETIGDAMALATNDNNQSGATDGTYVYAFYIDDIPYRVIADLPSDTFQKIMDLEYDDPDYDKKYNDLVSPLKIDRYEDLSLLVPVQEELDKLVGKTGGELLDDGWTSWGYNLDTMEFWMHKEPLAYTVVFEGEFEPTEDMDEEEAIRPLVVKSVTYDGIGDATVLENE